MSLCPLLVLRGPALRRLLSTCSCNSGATAARAQILAALSSYFLFFPLFSRSSGTKLLRTAVRMGFLRLLDRLSECPWEASPKSHLDQRPAAARGTHLCALNSSGRRGLLTPGRTRLQSGQYQESKRSCLRSPQRFRFSDPHSGPAWSISSSLEISQGTKLVP